ncbi:hypothetical protein UM93_14705 [Psychromicrobium lacuslunae]|uniref:Ig-like domain-containing protein n=1 Tax=Psychromicrobium lacuslunae TaxID=1618207 RepID=A0A0D4C1J4_9MICC|nr:hypothetical protein UM93_14705 [Psychromicrobium lacuslunae]
MTVLALVASSLGTAVSAAPAAEASTAGCAASLYGLSKPSLFQWVRPAGSIQAVLTNLRTSDLALLQKKTSSGWVTQVRNTMPRPGVVLTANAAKGTSWRVVVKRGPISTGYCATYTFGPVTR